ncbi:MAG: NAD(P)(+) transhydrogenase (Re/Si-specific) subunit beta [Vampirovibrio sp.]|nr:NAD(P)(+) transhydrogenase (Re/Si-specific) subunit beta [Vampirovibrio sp.]
MNLNPDTASLIAYIGYLVSIFLFVVAIKRLGKVKTARSANQMAAGAMALAVVCTLVELGTIDYTYILIGAVLGGGIGLVLATSVQMTAMPQLVAVFNGFGGAASTLVALSLFTAAEKGVTLAEMDFQGEAGYMTAIALVLSIIIGAVTLTGSLMAYMKLSEVFGRMFGKPILLPLRHFLNIMLIISVLAMTVAWVATTSDPTLSVNLAIGITVTSLVLGILLTIPIGGADMPVVISLLNSYSGLAASAAGFALNSNVLIVSGALVGASGLILTQIMCKGMNRSLANVMMGGFGGEDTSGGGEKSEYVNVKSAEPEEAAMDFEDARDVIIVPGYGLAVAQGQNAIKELSDQLKKRGCQVRYAIHPVAGRMPGHMNVLLAESNVPYDELVEMEAINNEFQKADIALIVGANDVVNPSAKEDKSSPLYGMPVLNVEQSRMVFVIKRGLGAGFSGVKNVLFEKDNTRMIYGDAKKVLEELTTELSESDN